MAPRCTVSKKFQKYLNFFGYWDRAERFNFLQKHNDVPWCSLLFFSNLVKTVNYCSNFCEINSLWLVFFAHLFNDFNFNFNFIWMLFDLKSYQAKINLKPKQRFFMVFTYVFLIKFKLKTFKNIEKVCKKNRSERFYFRKIEETIDR